MSRQCNGALAFMVNTESKKLLKLFLQSRIRSILNRYNILMNKFFNFKTISRLASIAIYVWVIIVLVMDSFGSSAALLKSSDHHMTWLILFLVLDMWLFRRVENSDK